ncbi:MAG: rRNA pseudouridine synthase [Gammaproteobacteria bacterium]|nr:rRNA pseudouridine synthase [Gammaproteobacteria bacterium]NND53837.1 rRNA pseudouridine synthase [Gammaproteobacteria bacterium]
MAERLQKYLAGLGKGSRRQIEGWIKAGRIQVNGEPAELGMRVDGSEHIVIDGQPLRKPKRERPHRTLMYHKPAGEICSRTDPDGRRTVFDALPKTIDARWISVGRLDYQTTGLLLVTTDGELANKLMHPSSQLSREYSVRVRGELSDEAIEQLLNGIKLDDGEARFDTLSIKDSKGANQTCLVTVSEGRNRIVRRLFEQVGCTVSRLMRVSYGPLKLPRNLRPGKHRKLEPEEAAALRAAVR